ncbi:hypothetical protein [Streptomyces sp. NPDC050738]|uniref:hypothetical protein n=1 Tax=Streptomyces sp. NPDC050738 TaxID=3154744 RepID=UPI003414D3FB
MGALSSCQQPSGGGSPQKLQESPQPTGFGATFLGTQECSSRGKDFREVSCTSEKAYARVLVRYEGSRTTGPACPGPTDFVLYIAETTPALAEGANAAPDASATPSPVARGYACMRTLEPPHPGDPGKGGGPRTVVGDCVYNAGKGQVKETACDGAGETQPEFKVMTSVARRALCPPTTKLYVQLGGTKPVGCARRA